MLFNYRYYWMTCWTIFAPIILLVMVIHAFTISFANYNFPRGVEVRLFSLFSKSLEVYLEINSMEGGGGGEGAYIAKR